MAKKKSSKVKWIDTPGLMHILKEEIPLAANVLLGNKYNHVLVRGKPRIGKSYVRDKILKESDLSYKDTVNCVAMPPDLLDSALFGHVKGAFTGATSTRIGLLDDKNDKTKSQVVFLEEIGELPQSLQAKLLVFLDSGIVQPLGVEWGKGRTSTVRIIATTNVDTIDLREDMRGRFWEVFVPPLHERRSDIPILVNHFLKDTKLKPSGRSLAGLTSYNWPGGVTQIEKICMRLKAKQSFEDIAPNPDWYHLWDSMYLTTPGFMAHKIDELFPIIAGNKFPYELDDFQKEFHDFWVFFGQDLNDENDLISNVRQFKKTQQYKPVGYGAFKTNILQNNEKVFRLMGKSQEWIYHNFQELLSHRLQIKAWESEVENEMKDDQANDDRYLNADVTQEELLKNYWAYLLDVCGLSNKDASKIAGVSEGTISKKRDKYNFPKRKK